MTRIAIIGAGALGTVYGAVLARGGAEVQLLAREPHARAVQEAGGVTVTAGDETWTAALSAEWEPHRLAPAEIAILLTKGHDSEAALAPLGHLRDSISTCVSLQNGVAKNGVLSAWAGRERTLGGVSMVGATLQAPGRVALTSPGPTFLGELPSGTSPRVEALVALLRAGGLPAFASDRVLEVEWSKLIHAAPVMTLTALSRLPFHAALIDPSLSALYVRLVREGAAIADAAGAAVADPEGMFPVLRIAQLPFGEAVALVRERGEAMAAAGASQVRISMLEDVARGRRAELDDVHGHLVAEADRHDVPAPLSRVALDLLAALDRTRDDDRRPA